ncbi:MAG: hypothetical protein IKM18_09335 [Clostridia bacterium]|nr:hypothetical protein [Clostridia bacterium]
MRKTISLILLIALLAASVFGCTSETPNDEPDNETKDEIKEEKEDEIKEEKEPDDNDKQEEMYKDGAYLISGEEKCYGSITFFGENYIYDGPIHLENPVVIVGSADELFQLDPNNKLNFKDKYTSEFFETKALILAKFEHGSIKQFIELSGIVIKDGKLCPVMTGWFCPDANGSADYFESIIYAEIFRDDIMEPGELYVLNIWDLSIGIGKYQPLDGKLWRYAGAYGPR